MQLLFILQVELRQVVWLRNGILTEGAYTLFLTLVKFIQILCNLHHFWLLKLLLRYSTHWTIEFSSNTW